MHYLRSLRHHADPFQATVAMHSSRSLHLLSGPFQGPPVLLLPLLRLRLLLLRLLLLPRPPQRYVEGKVTGGPLPRQAPLSLQYLTAHTAASLIQ